MGTAADRIDDHEGRIRTLETTGAVSAVSVAGIERRLDKMEGTLVWLVRVIVGAIILWIFDLLKNGGIGL